MYGKAYLQVQDVTGRWVNVGSTLNQDQMIKSQLDSLGRMYAGKTIRAVDGNGNILQMK